MRGDLRDEGIVVVDHRSLALEEIHDLVGGGLPVIGNARLVGDAQHENPASLQGASRGVDRLKEAVGHVVGHAPVDLPRKFDEPSVEVELARLPSEVVRIDRDAVSPHAGAGIEGHESERLGLGGIDHFPDVDPHGGEDPLEFVDEGDVDEAEDVLRELHGLSRVATADRNDLLHSSRVEPDRPIEAGGGESPDDLGHLAEMALGISRILALGREGEGEVDSGLHPRSLLEDFPEILARRSGVGARLERDEHAGSQARGDLLARPDDESEIRIEVGAERCGNADDDCLALGEPALVRGEGEELLGHGGGDSLRGDGGDG